MPHKLKCHDNIAHDNILKRFQGKFEEVNNIIFLKNVAVARTLISCSDKLSSWNHRAQHLVHLPACAFRSLKIPTKTKYI